jgi:hypothetical protein
VWSSPFQAQLTFPTRSRDLGSMTASSHLMITEAERLFPVPVRMALPPGGLGERLNRTHDAT